jgi:RHS repeat-associated protein
MKYTPFGEEDTITDENRTKYGTYRRDEVSGLDYAKRRYYSSELGRFISPDPYIGSIQLDDPDSWNRYAYCGNDPINHIDPNGTFCSGPCWSSCVLIYSCPVAGAYGYGGWGDMWEWGFNDYGGDSGGGGGGQHTPHIGFDGVSLTPSERAYFLEQHNAVLSELGNNFACRNLFGGTTAIPRLQQTSYYFFNDPNDSTMMYASGGYEIWVNLAERDLFTNANYVGLGTVNVMYTAILHELGHNTNSMYADDTLGYDLTLINTCGNGT